MEKILMRRGLEADLSTAALSEGEIGYCTDTHNVYIGTSSGTPVKINGSGGGSTNLDGLNDVDTTTTAPTDGQVLKYNASSGLWKPAADNTGSGGGSALVASYTHTKNKEVAVSAINYTDGTFTSIAHGLANGDILTIIPNSNAVATGNGGGFNYIVSYYPTGIAARTKYYVVNSQTDSFQLSATSGGTAIVPTNPSSTVDVTKWHFERQVDSDIYFASLTPAYKYRVVISGKVLRSNYGQVAPNYQATSTAFPYSNMLSSLSSNAGGWGAATTTIAGDLYSYREFDLNAEGYYIIRGKGVDFASNNTTTYTQNLRDFYFISQDTTYFNKQITSVKIQAIDAANGLTVQIYSV